MAPFSGLATAIDIRGSPRHQTFRLSWRSSWWRLHVCDWFHELLATLEALQNKCLWPRGPVHGRVSLPNESCDAAL